MVLRDKLSSVSDRIKELQAEEARLLQARKDEVSSALEKIPGLLELDNLIIVGILNDGMNLINSDPTKIRYFEEQAYKLPSFKRRKANRSKAEEAQNVPEATTEETTA